MNKSGLVNRLAEEKGLPDSTAKEIVDTVFDDIIQTLIKGDRVEVRGFGSFKMKVYKGYTGRNPRSGEKVEVKPKRSLFFKAGKELKKRVDIE